MKKMVCEICGSQTIKKENGSFVCQECGTEYALEEAKSLLKEVGCTSSSNDAPLAASRQQTDVSGKEKLIQLLYAWAELIGTLPNTKEWFEVDYNLEYDNFWNDCMPKIADNTYLSSFKKIVPEDILDYYLIKEKNYELTERFYGKKCLLKDIINSKTPGTKVIEEMERFCRAMWNHYGIYMDVKKTRSMFSHSFADFSFSVDHINNDKFADLVLFLANVIDSTLYYKTKKIFGGVVESHASLEEQRTFDKFVNFGKQTIDKFVETHNQLMDCYISNYNNMCEMCKTIYSNCLSLEADLFLPYKYRNLSSILDLIEIVRDGKATNWQDLINLYDTQEFRKDINLKMDIMNAQLDKISKTLRSGFSIVIPQLANVEKNLSSINDKIADINQHVAKIDKYSFLTMWGTI